MRGSAVDDDDDDDIVTMRANANECAVDGWKDGWMICMIMRPSMPRWMDGCVL